VVDAQARAAGNRHATAVTIGTHLFAHPWPVQILKVYVDGAGGHEIAGLALSGVKFKRPLTRAAFVDDVTEVIATAFGAARLEEVDLWCEVPLDVGKGVVVSGDYAKPAQRTVFTVTVLRGETPPSYRTRIVAGRGVYWDRTWQAQALHR